MTEDLRQVPLGRLAKDHPSAVDAVLRRVFDRGDKPARAQAAAFNSNI